MYINISLVMLYLYITQQEDMVLSSILEHMHPQWIISYHEHDSLLEHVFDEELSEAERKAAWDNYKQEKAAETARYGRHDKYGAV